MNLGREVVVLAGLWITMLGPSATTFAGQGAAQSADSIADQVQDLFAKADRLAAERKQRSKEYLWSLPDEGLAELYAKATAPQQLPPAGLSGLAKAVLEEVRKGRREVVERLLKYSSPLDERDAESFRLRHSELVEQLAALGPESVPALAARMGEDYRMMGHLTVAKEALLKMGPDALEPLLFSLRSTDSYLRSNAVCVLSEIGDARAKDAFLRAASDESGLVRRWAVQGLLKLGPGVVGKDKLVALLIEGLQDGSCLYESIRGLERYGDESAIEHLRVIERFHIVRGKGDLRYFAGQSINSILRRSGKPAEKVSREHYSDQRPSYEELKDAAVCANVGIRCSAIDRLGRYRDEQTAMFLIERWQQEQNPQVLNEIARTFCFLVTVPKEAPASAISKAVMQKAFDAFISVPETKPVLSANILLACEVSAQIHDFIPSDGNKVLKAAVTGARGILYAAGNREIKLERVDRFKSLIRALGLPSKDQSVRDACYSAITTIAIISAKTGTTWSAQERNELQVQLSPLLYSPNPSIRLIECLGHIGDQHLMFRLIELLGHGDPSIRRFAADALGRIGDPQALPALERVAQNDPYQYENGVYGVRQAAAEAVQRIRREQTVPR